MGTWGETRETVNITGSLVVILYEGVKAEEKLQFQPEWNITYKKNPLYRYLIFTVHETVKAKLQEPDLNI